MKEYDLAILGGGPGGYVAAIRAAQLGLKTVVIEKNRVGGTCLNVGCIPTKALLHVAEILEDYKAYKKVGITFDPPSLDIKKIRAFKDRTVNRSVRGVEYLFKENGVELIQGKGIIREPGVVEIEGDSLTLRAKNIILATGSEPLILKGMEVDGEKVITSNEALELKELPSKLIIVGAGVIGLEIGTVYKALGSDVEIIELFPQILPGMDKEMVEELQKMLEKKGIEFHLESRVVKIERGEKPRVIFVKDGKEQAVEGDQVLVAVGRKPTLAGVDVESLGLKLKKGGFVEVDEALKTSVEGMFAIGDIAGPPMLAHKAMKEGIVASEIVAGIREKFSNKAIPSVVYTHPELASVGLTEEKAREEIREIRVGRFPFAASGRAHTTGKPEGLVKVITDSSGKILGMHILGPGASDMIMEGAIAVELGLKAQEISDIIHPHPTYCEAIMEAAMNVFRSSIHIPNK